MSSVDEVVLEVRSLGFRYPRGAEILSNIEFKLFRGEVVALTGPSGRGKSTLLYLLGLLLQPTSGDIIVNGTSTRNLNDVQKSRMRAFQYGFVFQDAALDATRTVLDNVLETAIYRREGRDQSALRATELLRHLGVALRAEAKPGQVSGGQAQRIALCRALLNSPSIILADEPTGNLDAGTADIVLQTLRERAEEGALVVVSTHDPRLVKRCDRVFGL